MNDEEDEPLLGENEFYDLVTDLETRAVELADKLGLSNEDLQKLAGRWLKIAETQNGPPFDGYLMAHMTHQAVLRRRLQLLVDMMKPGEEMVSLVELRDRFKKKRGDA